VHQFCRLGAHSFTAMNSLLFADLPPFAMCQGQPAQVRSMNYEGMKRRGFSAAQIQAVKHMHKALYRQDLSLQAALEQIQAMSETDASIADVVDLMSSFLVQVSPNRGIIR